MSLNINKKTTEIPNGNYCHFSKASHNIYPKLVRGP